MFTGISKYILIALLLLGQGSVLAHELDLEAHQTGDSCESCLLHSALGDAQASTATISFFAANYFQTITLLPSPLINRAFNCFQSRAPPQPTFV